MEVGLAPEGKIRTIANTDEYKEALKYMNSLYELGAIYDGDLPRQRSSCALWQTRRESLSCSCPAERFPIILTRTITMKPTDIIR